MEPGIWVILGIMVLFVLLFFYSACRICAEYDKEDERLFEDWLQRRINAAIKEQSEKEKKEAEK